MSSQISRRDWLTHWLKPLKKLPEASASASATRKPAPALAPAPARRQVALIQGRYCIAYETPCSSCHEHCPQPGAIIVESGIPMIEPDQCTGCAICRDVCPAPTNAILVMPRRNISDPEP